MSVTTTQNLKGNKAVFWGLRNKVLIPAILITVLTGVLLTLWMTNKMKTIIYQDQGTQGLLLCNFLLFDTNEKVLKAKPDAAREFLQDYQSTHAMPYIFVLGEENKVVAHTFEGDLPPAIQTMIGEEKGNLGLQRKEILVEGKAILDIGAPIPDAPGMVHIGMDLSRAQQQIEKITLNALEIVLAILVAGIALLWIVMSRIITPIQALTGVARNIVREGDLTQKITVHSKDEVGELADYFNQMVEWQKNTLGNLSASILMLNEIVRDLEGISESQNQSVTVQATSLQETQVTAQEIKQTSQMASQKAEEILQMTGKADEISRTGEVSVEQSLKGLTDIRQQVQEIAQKIGELTDRTRQIGSITDTVKDLADQSNMLALNAAIEAVRSGEHGKGFGLVAREIRRLADQSIQATGRVKEILDNISDAIVQVAKITESGSKRMEGGYILVKNSGENMRALTGVIKDNSASVRQIASAVNQQNIGINQIFSAVTDQTQMMSEAVKNVETTAGMVKVLKETSKRLSEAVGKYKV